ncbi:hypothetical protein GCM10011609_30790 [Lentzea pudingi]|uniref:Uncharacterized protein n=1 Tax=Lentzea pudingi TaxID=1789439 RepID=A0ABQ2HVS2_9PSEU|nr:hypothetical protein GCM10011609_30790 [Lentzea pudingi]
MAAQHLQALPRHHPVQAGHVRERRRALAADLDAVVVQRAGHPPRDHQRVRVRQRETDHRHPDHVLAAVERRVDLLRPHRAHQRGVVVPVHPLAAHHPVQQEPLPAVGALPSVLPVRGQVTPHRGGVDTGGRGEDAAQFQHVPGFAGLRELAQHTGRAAQVLPRQCRQRRHLLDAHPAVGPAPPDLGGRQRGPVAGVFERDHPHTRGTARSNARV